MSSVPLSTLQALASQARSTYISISFLIGALFVFPVAFVLVMMVTKNLISPINAIALFFLLLTSVLLVFVGIYNILIAYMIPVLTIIPS
jgi:hypothetical protein